MLDNNQTYIIVDIESDGPVPGLYSMLSIGAVASTHDKEISSFYRKLLPYENATQDDDTMKWWSKHPEAWKEVTTGAEEAGVVIEDFCLWVNNLNTSPVFVASPLAFDFSFVNWYIEKFTESNPFVDYTSTQRTLDLVSFASGKFSRPLSQSRHSQLPDSLKENMPRHSHKAIEDARGYGVLLRNILNS